MTKAFLHGRTEAIRSVQPQSVNFINVRLNNYNSYLSCVFDYLNSLAIQDFLL